MARSVDLRIEEMEEQLRREMPLLDVPENLSAQNIAVRLTEKRSPGRTPVYVRARSAVAAALVMAIGFGALRAAGIIGGGKKEAAGGGQMETEPSGGYYYSDDSIAPEGEVFPADTDSNIWDKAKNESMADVLRTTEMGVGEELVISTDIPFDGTAVKCYSSAQPDAADPDGICEVRLTEGESGESVIELSAVSPGDLQVELIRNGEMEFHLNITVRED